MPYDPNANYREEKPLLKTLRVGVVISSFVIFFISCFSKCFCTATFCADSFQALLSGWLVVMSGAGVAWLANPLLLITWILLLRNNKFALLLSIFATLLSLSFLGIDEVPINEAGGIEKIIKIEIGYWLWLFSCLITFIGSISLKILKFKYE